MTNRSFNTENLDQSRITHTLQNNPGNVRDLYQENEGFKVSPLKQERTLKTPKKKEGIP